MLPVPAQDRSFRVLGLFPHPRHTGHVVLGPDGVVPGSAFCAETRRLRTPDARVASLSALVRTSVAQHDVRLVAVARPCDVREHPSLAADVVTAIGALGVSVEVLDERSVGDLLHAPSVSGFDHLGQTVSRVFFPELARSVPSWRRGHEQQRRRIRPLWKATATSLVALTKLRPAAIRALARGPIPPGLAALLDSLDPTRL